MVGEMKISHRKYTDAIVLKDSPFVVSQPPFGSTRFWGVRAVPKIWGKLF